MIKEFVTIFDDNREKLKDMFREKHPESYLDIMKALITVINPEPEDYGSGLPDFNRITVIDHGDYQGTFVFVVAEHGYQPDKYWATSVSYGSCSGCDTLQDICYSDYGDKPTEEQVRGYFTLALHLLQKLVCITQGE